MNDLIVAMQFGFVQFLLGIWLTATTHGGGLPAAGTPCTLERIAPWFRSDTSAFVIAEASPDSILDGIYYHTIGPLTKDSTVGGVMPRAVYGQIAELRRTEPGMPGMSAGNRIVLVWWQLGASCERVVPRRAIEAEAAVEVFIAVPLLRPRPEWIGGLPTFDVDFEDRANNLVYSESLTRTRSPPSLPAFMTAREYADFYVGLPLHSAFRRNAGDAIAQIVHWGEAHPNLARKYPAADNIAAARARIRLR